MSRLLLEAAVTPWGATDTAPIVDSLPLEASGVAWSPWDPALILTDGHGTFPLLPAVASGWQVADGARMEGRPVPRLARDCPRLPARMVTG